jgi:hypothetical protein
MENLEIFMLGEYIHVIICNPEESISRIFYNTFLKFFEIYSITLELIVILFSYLIPAPNARYLLGNIVL